MVIIDNDEDFLKRTKQLLLRNDISVVTAIEGETGIEEAIRSKPDMIILDLNLSDMDSYDTFRILINGKITSQIPIVMTTNKETTIKDQADGLDMGACDYFKKPMNYLASRCEVSKSK